MRPCLVLLLLPVFALAARAGSPPLDLVEGNTRFACDLYAQLKAQDGNLFFSPHSISTCLAMVRAGAGGQTAAEMDEVLHYPPKALGSKCSSLAEALRAPEVWDGRGREARKVPAYEIAVANRLFGQKGYPFRPAYLDELARDFAAGLEALDIRSNPSGARTRINRWVEEQTQKRIRDLLPPSSPTADTRLVVVNAIYFKSQWDEQFSESSTQDGPFHRLDGSQVRARFMHQTEHFRYAETEDVQVLEMPYREHRLSMIVVLPKAMDGLRAVEARLSPETLAAWRDGLSSAKVAVQFPRFEFSSGFDLTQTLATLGMPTAFSASDADFSGMTERERLFVGLVVHKGFVAVDENGTEAAAATAVGMLGAAAPPPEEPKEFRADHPFLFLIHHRATGSILFLGRLLDP